MKKCIILLVVMLSLTSCVSREKMEKGEVQKSVALKKLSVNSLGQIAADISVSDVEWSDNVKLSPNVNSVFNVKTKQYTKNQINNIMETLTDEKVTKVADLSGESHFSTKEGDLITYNKSSGNICYYSYGFLSGEDKVIDKKETDAIYKNKADDLLADVNITDDIDCEYQGVKLAEYVEYIEDGKTRQKPITYRVDYLQKQVDGTELDGVLPGVSVEFNASNEICSLNCVAREVSDEIASNYPSKNKEEIEQEILSGKEVLYEGLDEKDADIKITHIKQVYYSDAANLQQTVMMPYYEVTAVTKSENKKINLLLPAIKDTYLEYKTNG